MASSSLYRSVSGTHRELSEKKEIVIQRLKELNAEEVNSENQQEEAGSEQKTPTNKEGNCHIPATEALKTFFDRIPLSSIPGIRNEGVLEIQASDSMGEAIKRLYQENVMGAPVRMDDPAASAPASSSVNNAFGSILSDPYIGLIEFSGMVLWALEELEKADAEARRRGFGNVGSDPRFLKPDEDLELSEGSGFFNCIQRHPTIRDTKVEIMAHSFRWGPFLPLGHDETLLHALLMLSKHSLKAVPVVDSSKGNVIGFVTQDVAVRLLLQCVGLQWFDIIANKKICELRFGVDDLPQTILHIEKTKTIFDAIMLMWKHRVSGLPIIDPHSKRIEGNLRSTDVRILLDNVDAFERRRTMTVEEFTKLDLYDEAVSKEEQDQDQDMGATISSTTLYLRRGLRPKMRDVVTCTHEETLNTIMQRLVHKRSDRGFLVDDNMCILSVITLRDIIIQFAPPLIELTEMQPGFV